MTKPKITLEQITEKAAVKAPKVGAAVKEAAKATTNIGTTLAYRGASSASILSAVSFFANGGYAGIGAGLGALGIGYALRRIVTARVVKGQYQTSQAAETAEEVMAVDPEYEHAQRN